ncbi:glycosyltransferase [Pasteurellaceae bacterium Macca]|nr:glycosyltransferase [Pasteurellaceae bacterium Macca]
MFSIIVPSYNRHHELPPLLASLSQQTDQRFEVIIVDDHSQQAVEITQDYGFAVTIIRNTTNQGAAESRNIGANHANYDWLLFLDDDDRFAEEKCAELAKTIAEKPEVNFIYHPAKCIMVNEQFDYMTKPYANIQDIHLDNILRANKIGGMPMLAIKKSFFIEIAGLSSTLRSLEDYEFVLKAISHPQFSPAYVDKALTVCTFHTQRQSVSTNTTHTEQAITEIEQQYVKTPAQKQAFQLNALYMLAHPRMMNLSRSAAKYYWKMFMLSKNIKHALIALVIFISPQLAINLKRFI